MPWGTLGLPGKTGEMTHPVPLGVPWAAGEMTHPAPLGDQGGMGRGSIRRLIRCPWVLSRGGALYNGGWALYDVGVFWIMCVGFV